MMSKEKMIVGIAIIAIVLFIAFRSCNKLEIKQRSSDDKSKFSVEVKKEEADRE